MYTIKIPQIVIDCAASGQFKGTCVGGAVEVDWPEFRLTEEQMLANEVARLDGREEPYPDRHIILLEVPYATPTGEKVPA